ncbi:hypothetical protein IC762_02765 [Bradyrhizobium genosp. L]|uniref:hypothetical protein n=1 Tax=Bradyrhizobium genosp. L TaxID=83637 RepID=UPI0018A250F7|nr:hypothetical protein [Bradyrhizobium genosp. L]QPF85274.1 hypothetical protein IC762_02765 [Bradyrhizobium genosp. L]
MTNRCSNSECGRPFGLIRRSWHFEQFCSTKCCETYKRQLQRNSAYWKWLCYAPEPAARRKNLIQRSD